MLRSRFKFDLTNSLNEFTTSTDARAVTFKTHRYGNFDRVTILESQEINVLNLIRYRVKLNAFNDCTVIFTAYTEFRDLEIGSVNQVTNTQRSDRKVNWITLTV